MVNREDANRSSMKDSEWFTPRTNRSSMEGSKLFTPRSSELARYEGSPPVSYRSYMSCTGFPSGVGYRKEGSSSARVFKA